MSASSGLVATRDELVHQFDLDRFPQFLKEMIENRPEHGDGVHQWLFRTARQLHAHMDEDTMFQLLSLRAEGCGRDVPDQEVRDAIANSVTCAWRPGQGGAADHSTKKTICGPMPKTKVAPRWPDVDIDKRQATIDAESFTLAALSEQSPIRLEENGPNADDLIDGLFPANCLLCIGKSSRRFATRQRETWRGRLQECALIVPSPMSARTGKRKKDGLPSEHTLDNTGPRRFLVTEFDHGSCDEQASLLCHLSYFAPLVLVVHSGGKSLHGWFHVEGQDDKDTRAFFRYAVGLGADPATWTPSQFVRLPWGRRDNGAVQRPYFFNPHAVLECQ